MSKGLCTLFLFLLSLAFFSSEPHILARSNQTGEDKLPDLQWFFDAAGQDEGRAKAALGRISPLWKDSYAAMVLDLISVIRVARQSEKRVKRLVEFLEDMTGQRFGGDLNDWRHWVWSLPDEPHPRYGYFKGFLYGAIDPRMKDFFPLGVNSSIRLDQIEWGGVKVNGIPPLDHPAHTTADKAKYLKKDDIIFGVVVDDKARAYPKRIIAWHELVRDKLGGIELALVYCTLCGAAIPYESMVNGTQRTFGTSGLLYRSNKLLFDEESNTLWSALARKPVLGELAGSQTGLRSRPIVTTTWGEWVSLHPDTTVLSKDTGFERDYSEGEAYRDYFSHDDIWYQVPKLDNRLKNKDEVLALVLEGNSGEETQVAISVKFLKKKRVFQFQEAGHSLLVLTSDKGASWVYQVGANEFQPRKIRGELKDQQNRSWKVTEKGLLLEGEETDFLPLSLIHI